jgi:hypothetical protein
MFICDHIYARGCFIQYITVFYTLDRPFERRVKKYGRGFSYDLERGGKLHDYDGLTTFYQNARSHDPYAQVSRRLGDGGALTILRFSPLHGCIQGWVFMPYNACEPGSSTQGCILANQFLQG